MRTLYDSVTPRNILKANPTPQMVGGYLNGPYAWSQADWDLFPNAVHVRISVRASFLDGHVLDVETGDATPAEAPGWITARRNAGADPSIYCNRSTWPQVAAACQAAGVPEPHYFIATASGQAQIPMGAVAAQYLLDVAPGIDVSAVADYWPGVDGPATNPTSSTTPQEDDMAFGTPAPAGTNEHVDVGVAGCKQLRIHTSFGHVVHVRAVLFYGDTGADPNGTGEGGGYDGEFRTPKARWDWAPNRPGPIAIPTGSTSCTVLYDADHSFYISAAAL